LHHNPRQNQTNPVFGDLKMADRLLSTGIVGTIVMALCCFTPILVWVLAGIGLAGAIAYLDMVLLPALAIFIAMTGYALWKRNRAQ